MSFSIIGSSQSSSGKIQVVHVIKSTSSITIPSDVSNIEILLCGGGGGGAAASYQAGQIYRSGPGGGGSVDYRESLSVIPGQTYTVTIGAGGSGGIDLFNYNSTNGGTSSFGALFSVAGGFGATFTSPNWDLTNGGKPSGRGGWGKYSWSERRGIPYTGESTPFGYGGGGGAGNNYNTAGLSPDWTGGAAASHGAGRGNGGNNNSLGTGPMNAQPNTGSGGGGGATTTSGNLQSGSGDYSGGNGGSGIAIIKYWTAT